jgi:hypothetical protein
LASEFTPDINPTEVVLGILGVASVILIYRMLNGVKSDVAREVTRIVLAHLQSRNDTQATQIAGQPLRIRTEEKFVDVSDFNARFQEISGRFQGIEVQIKDQVERTDKYLHEMRHEMRNELQALKVSNDEGTQVALSSVGKVHGRVDRVAESLGEVRGQLGEVSNGIKELRTMLLNRGVTKA